MLVSIQDLRSIQERCEIGELVQRLDVSIDRLTVIWDTDTGSLRRIFKNLKQAISTKLTHLKYMITCEMMSLL